MHHRLSADNCLAAYARGIQLCHMPLRSVVHSCLECSDLVIRSLCQILLSQGCCGLVCISTLSVVHPSLITSTGIAKRKGRNASHSPYVSISKATRGYLRSILDNPESRKIFYFLVLNMCYMLVQMLYGIWTNSLGLISDGQMMISVFGNFHANETFSAIHMAFDCMAIGVGLIASVMARWEPNERFTYG